MKKSTLHKEIIAVLQEANCSLTPSEIKDKLIERGLNWNRKSKKPLEEKQILLRIASTKYKNNFDIAISLNN